MKCKGYEVMLRDWESLPRWMKKNEVREYYDILVKRKKSLKVKRTFDIIMASILLGVMLFPMLIIALIIEIDSPGNIFYRQERITAYGKKFRIHKFRTMVDFADQIGGQITFNNDNRITRIGNILRKYRLDELPQLIDILEGNMSFVGTRPEVPKYVREYSNEMRATLLLSAGVTSEASIRYKNEAKLLNDSKDIDMVYLEKILPEKMKYNLESIRKFNFFEEMKTISRTILAVLGKDYSNENRI